VRRITAFPLLAALPALLGAAAFAAPAAGATAPEATAEVFPYDIHEQVLGNGMRVVVVPFDSPGTLAYFTVVRTGSRDEVEAGHSGFAHFFEHMMFRGTEKYPSDRYNEILKGMGADSNAFTSDDLTAYYIIGPAAELATLMDMEADRFQNLKYTEEAFRTEAGSILGEYNKNVTNPFLPMYERMRDLAFDVHTYEHTTMGFLQDIEKMPQYYEYSLGFFDRFYRPENTILLVVGDVEPARVFAMARAHYGGWEKGYQAPPVEVEPAQTEGRDAHIDWATPIRPHLMIGFRAPAFTTANVDSAGINVLAQLLFSESAPLYQELVVEKQWVDFLQGSLSEHRDPYLFTVYTRIKSPDLLPEVRATIDRHLDRLKAEPVDAKTLERTTSHLRYAFALSLDSPGAVASALTDYLAVTGEPETINRLYAQYEKVTPADVQRLAREIFQPRERTVVTLSHEGSSGDRPAAAGKEGR
jgi:zinc protease